MLKRFRVQIPQLLNLFRESADPQLLSVWKKLKMEQKKSFSYVAKTIGSNMHSLGIKFFFTLQAERHILEGFIKDITFEERRKSPTISR